MFLCDKGIAILQTKFGFFLAFKQSVWFFLVSLQYCLAFYWNEIFICQPWSQQELNS